MNQSGISYTGGRLFFSHREINTLRGLSKKIRGQLCFCHVGWVLFNLKFQTNIEFNVSKGPRKYAWYSVKFVKTS